MSTPAEKLAESLKILKELQDDGIVALQTGKISRTHRERLLKNGFLDEVQKGWYIATSPTAGKGDTTSWYSNYWIFCRQFLSQRLGNDWCISPEQSLLLYGGNASVPQQMIIRSPGANNQTISFKHNTSLFLMRSDLPVDRERVKKDDVNLFSLPAALVWSSANTYANNPIDVRAAMAMLSDASAILELLLEGGHSTIAGRLAGAFRNNQQERIADSIINSMQRAGYDVRETDPFGTKLTVTLSNRQRSPYENRIKLMWREMRDKIPTYFPIQPGLPVNRKAYLKTVEQVYITDAYHSLSIEKYIVTPELIERVKNTWDATTTDDDRKQRDAMAARGYWEAFQEVEKSIEMILEGKNPGAIADEHHGKWYSAFFAPSVTAGLLKASDLAGYRNHQVYIGGSMHTPLNREAIRDAMPALFEELTTETHAAVRAVLGHFIFVFIHPYMDGNGRMGRFLMNAMLASGGYPWTVIPVEQRKQYMQALEEASVRQNIKPFAELLGHLVTESSKGTPVAVLNNK